MGVPELLGIHGSCLKRERASKAGSSCSTTHVILNQGDRSPRRAVSRAPAVLARSALENQAGPGKIPRRKHPHRPDARARDAVMEDGMKALALVDAPDHVCCRYRVRAFEPALNRAGWSLDCLGPRPRPARPRRATRAAAAVTTRHPPAQALARLATPAAPAEGAAARLRLRRRRPVPRLLRPARPDLAAPARAGSRRPSGVADAVDRRQRLPGRLRPPRRGRSRRGPGRSRPASTPAVTRRPPTPDGDGLDLVWIGSSSTLAGARKPEGRSGTGSRGEVPGVRMRVICDRFPRFEAMPVVEVLVGGDRGARRWRRGASG